MKSWSLTGDKGWKQCAADRIVSSFRIVPPQTGLLLVCTMTCQGMGVGAISPPTIRLPFLIQEGIFANPSPRKKYAKFVEVYWLRIGLSIYLGPDMKSTLFLIHNLLVGQSFILHVWESLTSPKQDPPFFSGTIFDLVRIFVPLPQVLEHESQFDQFDHVQSTI